MSLETSLYTLLSVQCPRVFPDVAPYDTARPYITWQQVGGDPLSYVDDTVPDRRNCLIQINAWADTRLQANDLMLQIESALITSTLFQARPAGALIAAHDQDADRRGAMQDFSIWSTR